MDGGVSDGAGMDGAIRVDASAGNFGGGMSGIAGDGKAGGANEGAERGGNGVGCSMGSSADMMLYSSFTTSTSARICPVVICPVVICPVGAGLMLLTAPTSPSSPGSPVSYMLFLPGTGTVVAPGVAALTAASASASASASA